jgi:hypothetical protein
MRRFYETGIWNFSTISSSQFVAHNAAFTHRVATKPVLILRTRDRLRPWFLACLLARRFTGMRSHGCFQVGDEVLIGGVPFVLVFDP